MDDHWTACRQTLYKLSFVCLNELLGNSSNISFFQYTVSFNELFNCRSEIGYVASLVWTGKIRVLSIDIECNVGLWAWLADSMSTVQLEHDIMDHFTYLALFLCLHELLRSMIESWFEGKLLVEVEKSGFTALEIPIAIFVEDECPISTAIK